MRKKPALLKYFILFGCFVLVLATILLAFQVRLNDNLKQRANATLQDTAKHNIATITAKLGGQYQILETLAEYLAHRDSMNAEELHSLMSAAVTAGGFAMVGAADERGIALTHAGDLVDISDRVYYQQAMAGKRSVQCVRDAKLAQDTRIILSVPVMDDAQVLGMLYGSFQPESFYSQLLSQTFHGNEFSFLCDSSGNIIAKGNTLQAVQDSATLFDAYANTTFAGDMSTDALIAQMQAGNSGMLMLNDEGAWRYAIYTPLGLNDWYIFSSVPVSAVIATYSFISEGGLYLAIALVLAFVVLMFIVFRWSRQQADRLAVEAERLRQSEARYHMVDQMTDSVLFEADLQAGDITYNHNFEGVFGFAPTLLHVDCRDMPDSRVAAQDAPQLLALRNVLPTLRESTTVDFRLRGVGDQCQWVRAEFMPILDQEGVPCRILGKLSNVDKQVKTLQNLRRKAQLDSLTQLLNNVATRLAVTAYTADKTCAPAALLLLDLDNFKHVNDTLGHATGDIILQRIAAGLQKVFRANDIVGRMGGDEFVVLLENMPELHIAERKAKQMCDILQQLRIPNHEDYTLSGSVGVALFSRDGQDFQTLYHKADVALYRAKDNGKNQYAVYQPAWKDTLHRTP